MLYKYLLILMSENSYKWKWVSSVSLAVMYMFWYTHILGSYTVQPEISSIMQIINAIHQKKIYWEFCGDFICGNEEYCSVLM